MTKIKVDWQDSLNIFINDIYQEHDNFQETALNIICYEINNSFDSTIFGEIKTASYNPDRNSVLFLSDKWIIRTEENKTATDDDWYVKCTHNNTGVWVHNWIKMDTHIKDVRDLFQFMESNNT